MSLIGYVFSFNDRWVLKNAYEEREYAYLCIISPEICVTLLETICITLQLILKYKFTFILRCWR
jgi:hypothetical protein